MVNPRQFLILVVSILLSAPGGAQITVDGSLAEGDYQTIATKLNSNAGFGPGIDVAEIVYYPDTAGSVLYLGALGVLDTGSSDGMGLWLDLSGQGGATSGTNLGIGTGGDFHYINDGGGGQVNLAFKADFEVDLMFAVRTIAGTTADLFAGDLIGAAAASFVCQAPDLTGTSCTSGPTDFDGDGASGNITFAWDNSGIGTGLEMAIDFDAIGADSGQDLAVFAFVVSQTAFFSDVTVPGDLSPGNPGFGADFTLGDVNGDMTPDAGPWHAGPQDLPVEIQAFSIEP